MRQSIGIKLLQSGNGPTLIHIQAGKEHIALTAEAAKTLGNSITEFGYKAELLDRYKLYCAADNIQYDPKFIEFLH